MTILINIPDEGLSPLQLLAKELWLCAWVIEGCSNIDESADGAAALKGLFRIAETIFAMESPKSGD